MLKKVEPKTLAGFMELSPNDQVKFDQMKAIIQRTYEKFGFLPLDTPVIESSEVLLAKAGGETEKQIYRFNKGDSDLSLRFDLTVPLAKYVAEYYPDLVFPFKRYQIGKVYRGEKAQKGRYREFYQCDIDIIGEGELSIINDAQIPVIIYDTFKALGFEKFQIFINNRKILGGLFNGLGLAEKTADVLRIIDKLEKVGKEVCINELEMLGLTTEQIDKVFDLLFIGGTVSEKLEALNSFCCNDELYKEGVQELYDVVKYMRILGIPDTHFNIDLKIARGLDYYTGTVYETFLEGYERVGSVCSGGRYDDLASYYTDKKLPGVGISIGLTRLFYQLNNLGLVNVANSSISKALIVPVADEVEECLKVANYCRENGINTDIYLESNVKMKKKFKYADKWNIPYVVVIGEEEVKTGVYTLKNMKTGEQFKATLDELVSKLV